MQFEWDDAKDRLNRRKHGIGFETAARVFLDPLALSNQDRHVDGEERWQTIGMIDGRYVVVVAHTNRDRDGIEIIRIISARAAEPRERRRYEAG